MADETANNEAECEAIHRTADVLHERADRAAREGSFVLLGPSEARAIALLMLDLAGGDDQGVPNPLAVDVANAVVGPVTT